jgi:transglutaminase-like putative cysteine protease
VAEHGLNPPVSLFQRARRAEKLVTLALLLILLTAAVSGVTSVLRGPDWGLLWSSLLFGLLVGWGLAILEQPAWRAAAITIVLGLLYVLLVSGGVARQLITVLLLSIQTAFHNLFLPPGATSNLVPMALQLQTLSQTLAVLYGRVAVWVSALVTGKPVFDPVAAAMVWRLLVWSVASWAGWVVEARRSALLAVLPAILLSVGTLSYGQRNSATLYWVLGAALVLLATVGHDRRELAWDWSEIPYPARKGRQIGCVATLAAVGLVLLSLAVATFSIQRISKWFTRTRGPAVAQQGGLAESLGILPAATPVPDAFKNVRRPGLPRILLIGSGPELSGELVMSVQIPDLPSLTKGGRSIPLYWRSYTYDDYTGSGWSTSATQQTQAEANQPLGSDRAPDHVLVQQVVRPFPGHGGLLYADGEPVQVDQGSQSAWRSQGDLFGVQLDQGGPYQVSSLVPLVTPSQLRQAGQHYPDWVLNRYLALPSEVPDRVKSLALELTAGQPTPYDRTMAIESYLRKIPYTLDLPAPPPDRDLADYFIFDLRKGYCDYYATAMVVLARAAGIPARLAVGYASGEYNLNSGRFMVTQADAHSWVEVYFPKIGWVPFEPTAALPNLSGAAPSAATGIQENIPDQTTPAGGTISLLSWGWLLPLSGLILFMLGLAAWAGFDALRLRRFTGHALAAEIYRRLRSWGQRLGSPSEPGETPYEFSQALADRLKQPTWRGSALPGGFDAAGQILALSRKIVQLSYRPESPGQGPEAALLEDWHLLRWQLLRIWLWQRLGRFGARRRLRRSVAHS